MLMPGHFYPNGYYTLGTVFMDTATQALYTCSHCADQFKREDHLRRHELSHRSPKFKCDECGKSFHRNDVLKRHLLVHRPGANKVLKGGRKRVASKRGSIDGSTTTSQSQSPAMTPTVQSFPESSQAFAVPSWTPPGFRQSSSDPTPGICRSPTSPLGRGYPGDSSPELRRHSSPSCFLGQCVDRALQTFMVRFPLLHVSSLIDGRLPHELSLALAAIGARDMDGNSVLGMEYFIEAQKCLKDQVASSKGLRRLQCQVLLIEFAMFTGVAAHREWAMATQKASARAISHLLNDLPQSPQSAWAKWLYAEELKRTIFAFYCISVHSAMLQGTPFPLAARYITVTFPCSANLWNARNENEWMEALPLWRPECETNLTFSATTQAFLNGSSGMIQNDLQDRIDFTQHIVLCGILEMIAVSAMMPLNYECVDEWLPGHISSPRLRTRFLHALGTWWRLYVSAEDRPPDGMLWQTGDMARAKLEAVMLFYLARNKVVDASLAGTDDIEGLRSMAESGVNVLHQLVAAGLHEVMQNGMLPASPTILRSAEHLAQSTMKWLSRCQNCDTLPERDKEMINALTAAVSDALRAVPHALEPSPCYLDRLPELRNRVQDLWIYLLGGSQWLEGLDESETSFAVGV